MRPWMNKRLSKFRGKVREFFGNVHKFFAKARKVKTDNLTGSGSTQ